MSIAVDAIVERQVRRWTIERQSAERQTMPSPGSAPLITVSRLLGSGGREAAQRVANALGWALYDRELVNEIVRQSHVPADLVAEEDEHAPGKVVHWLEGILAQSLFDDSDYQYELYSVVRAIAASGPAVILGRGVNFLPRSGPRLDVRIVASLEARVLRVMIDQGVSRDRALTAIRRSDQERQAFTRRVHHARWDDASYYDLVINSSSCSLEGTVSAVLAAWHELAERLAEPLGLGLV